MYIWSCKSWPEFIFNQERVDEKCKSFDMMLTVMDYIFSSLNAEQQKIFSAKALSRETLNSSRIEGIELHAESVLDSVSRQMGLASPYSGKTDTDAEAVSKVTVDAVTNTHNPLTVERLFEWHSLLMKSQSGLGKPKDIGCFRKGPVYVVSGRLGFEQILFEGVPAQRVADEVNTLLNWIETSNCNPIVKCAIASFWFVTIHPFGDGNGRISRAISDYILSRFKPGPLLYYMSLSEAICNNRSNYYRSINLLSNQNSSMDATEWILWFIDTALSALKTAFERLKTTINTISLMNSETVRDLNSRQRDMLYKLVSGSFFGKLTNSKWMAMEKCPVATATRDLAELVKKGILIRSESGGRSTSYTLSPDFREKLEKQNNI